MFTFGFTPEEARILYGMLVTFLVPFVVNAIKQRGWSKNVNVALSIGVALAAAVLSEWAAGTLVLGSSIVVAAGVVFTAAQAHYATWFRALVSPREGA